MIAHWFINVISGVANVLIVGIGLYLCGKGVCEIWEWFKPSSETARRKRNRRLLRMKAELDAMSGTDPLRTAPPLPFVGAPPRKRKNQWFRVLAVIAGCGLNIITISAVVRSIQNDDLFLLVFIIPITVLLIIGVVVVVAEILGKPPSSYFISSANESESGWFDKY